MNNKAGGLRCCGRMVLVVVVAIGLTVSKKALADNNILVMDWESITGARQLNMDVDAFATRICEREEKRNEELIKGDGKSMKKDERDRNRHMEWMKQYKDAKESHTEQLHALIDSTAVTSTDLPVFVVADFLVPAKCYPSASAQEMAAAELARHKRYIANTFGVDVSKVDEAKDIAVVLKVVDPFNTRDLWPLPGLIIRKGTKLVEPFRGSKVSRDIFLVSPVDFGCGHLGYQCLIARVIELGLLRLASKMSWKDYFCGLLNIRGSAAVAAVKKTAECLSPHCCRRPHKTYIRTIGVISESLVGRQLSHGDILFGLKEGEKLSLSTVHEHLGTELDNRGGKDGKGDHAFDQTAFAKRKNDIYMEPVLFVSGIETTRRPRGCPQLVAQAKLMELFRTKRPKWGTAPLTAHGYPFPIYVHDGNDL
eukprot:GHVS01067080.1.p1 GENE.GHVS01067080.1~~GHVS01067080.1.p1  ORF type:complete len:423 (+),score=55.97 GHVS01067080.1:217-1485(+)